MKSTKSHSFCYFLILIIIIILLSNTISAQHKISVTVISNSAADSQKVFITGSHPYLGNWNPSEIELNKIDDSTFQKSFAFSGGEILEFKFTKGSWQKEALTEKGEVPGNYVVNVKGDSSLVFKIKFWRNELSVINSFKGQITGSVKYHKNIEGEGILPRDVIVWLPPDYNENSQKRFPVLYMHDGQNIVDPSTSYFGVDWQIDEIADSLIRKGEIESIIIVGINNTNERGEDYSPSPNGEAYMKLITEKIKPMIDANYRTLPDRKNTAVGGSSMGGIISLMMVWEYTHVFSKAICMSPAFKIGNIDYVRAVNEYSDDKKVILIYIDNGGIGLEERLQPGIDDMLKTLKEKGFEYEKDLFWILDKEAEHNEAAWAKRIPTALKILFGKT
ncbi:MAG: histidine kinase [Bacteroidetes bacterium]|nr:histidine kinase [Bacteroidota bacterium]